MLTERILGPSKERASAKQEPLSWEPSETWPIRRSAVLIGNDGIGKSSLHQLLTKGRILDPVPDVAELRIIKCDTIRGNLELELMDTSAENSHSPRQMAYEHKRAVLLCFAIDNPESLRRVKDYWSVEALHFRGYDAAEIILVGLKSDLRSDRKMNELITENNIEKIRREIVVKEHWRKICGIKVKWPRFREITLPTYFECSVKNGERCEELLAFMAKACVNRAEPRCKKSCVVM